MAYAVLCVMSEEYEKPMMMDVGSPEPFFLISAIVGPVAVFVLLGAVVYDAVALVNYAVAADVAYYAIVAVEVEAI